MQEVVLSQLRVEVEGVDECEASMRALGKGHGDRSVEVDDGRRGHLAEVGVEGGDAGEVRRRGRRGRRVPGGNLGLEQVEAGIAAQCRRVKALVSPVGRARTLTVPGIDSSCQIDLELDFCDDLDLPDRLGSRCE